MSADPEAQPYSLPPDEGDHAGAPKAWTAWYRFARDELGYEHEERVEYANLRFVEEQNRDSLRRRGSST